jgi:hypothetical protein
VGRAEENTGFRCAPCGTKVIPLTNGSYRNHCPCCLASLHVDREPGDRASRCFGVMDAVAVVRTKKGWQLIHRCRRCGVEHANRTAVDTDQPDEVERVIDLMRSARPGRR